MKVLFSSKGRRDKRINPHLFGCAKDTLIYVVVGCGAGLCSRTLEKRVLGKVKSDVIHGCGIKTQVRRRYRRHFWKLHPEFMVSEIFLKILCRREHKKGPGCQIQLRTTEFNKTRYYYVRGKHLKILLARESVRGRWRTCHSLSKLMWPRKLLSQRVLWSCWSWWNAAPAVWAAAASFGSNCNTCRGRRHRASNQGGITGPNRYQVWLSLLSTKHMERKINKYLKLMCSNRISDGDQMVLWTTCLGK